MLQGSDVTFIDSDDAYTKNFIPTFLKQIESYPDLLWEDVHQLKDSGVHQIRTLNERLMTPSRKSRDFSHGMDRPLFEPLYGGFLFVSVYFWSLIYFSTTSLLILPNVLI